MRVTWAAVVSATVHGVAWWGIALARAPVAERFVGRPIQVDVRAVAPAPLPPPPPPAPPPPPSPIAAPPPPTVAPRLASATRARPASSSPPRSTATSTSTPTVDATTPGSGSGVRTEVPDSKSPPGDTRPPIDLFGARALGNAAGINLAAPPSDVDTGYQPRRGVGARNGRGGSDVASFLSEDAGRSRVDKGLIPPELRTIERRLETTFDPPFAHVDVANRKELLQKQFVARMGKLPKVRDLTRSDDPSLETAGDKAKKIVDEAYFLGRRAEVFVRQRPDGKILEITLRLSSGYRLFDDEAIDAVEKALADRIPTSVAGATEVRTLWRLEATAFVVYSPTPQAKFDESSGKVEWVYPLQKRVDRKVQLMAVY